MRKIVLSAVTSSTVAMAPITASAS